MIIQKFIMTYKCIIITIVNDLKLLIKIASLGRQESQSTGTAKWPTTLSSGKILGITSVVRSIENQWDVLQKNHRPWFLTSSFHIWSPRKQL